MPRRGAFSLHLVGLLVVALVAGCAGAASPAQETPSPAVTPAPIATATPTPIATTAPTPTTPAATPSPTATPPRLPDAVVGIWAGAQTEPKGEVARIWSAILIMSPCGGGAECGFARYEAKKITEPVGAAIGCTYTLAYSGIVGGAFVFKESRNHSWGPFGGCTRAADVYLTPMPDGTLDIQEFWENRYTSHGTLHRVIVP